MMAVEYFSSFYFYLLIDVGTNEPLWHKPSINDFPEELDGLMNAFNGYI